MEKTYPYLMVDASYEYVREDERVVTDGVLNLKGVAEEGFREILSVAVAHTEKEATWSSVFSQLIDRGLEPREVKYIISDEHKGLRKASGRYFPKAIWQRCQAHYQQNAGSKVAHKARAEVHRDLRDIFRAPTYELDQQRAGRMIAKYQDRFSALTSWLEETIHEPLAVFKIPREHRQRMRTTNGLERYHEEVKRRTHVVRNFPNQKSCLRLVSALAMEQS